MATIERIVARCVSENSFCNSADSAECSPPVANDEADIMNGDKTLLINNPKNMVMHLNVLETKAILNRPILRINIAK